MTDLKKDRLEFDYSILDRNLFEYSPFMSGENYFDYNHTQFRFYTDIPNEIRKDISNKTKDDQITFLLDLFSEYWKYSCRASDEIRWLRRDMETRINLRVKERIEEIQSKYISDHKYKEREQTESYERKLHGLETRYGEALTKKDDKIIQIKEENEQLKKKLIRIENKIEKGMLIRKQPVRIPTRCGDIGIEVLV